MAKMDITYLFIEPVVSKFLFRKNREYECPYEHYQLQLLSESHRYILMGILLGLVLLVKVKLPTIGMRVTLTYKFSTTKFFRTTL